MHISLNTWRFFLAFLVVISHLLDGFTQGPAAYAVWGFFVLSGFLMTLTLNTKYGFTRDGIKHYAINRFLRIYPMYICGVLLGLIVLFLAKSNGIDPHYLNPAFGFPESLSQIIQNIVPLPFFDMSNLAVPVAWALFIEFFAYILMPLLAREKNMAWMALIVSGMSNFQLGFDLSTFVTRYSGMGTTMFAFSIGSLMFHYRKNLSIIKMPTISIAAWIANCAIWYYDDLYPWTIGTYISLILSAWVTISLIDIKPNYFGRLAGDVSYPLYLIHTTCGILVSIFLGQARTLTMFITSLIISCIISTILVYLVDRWVDKFKFHPEKKVLST